MEVIKAANLGVRFLLELCALGALGYWGVQVGGTTLMKLLLGVGVPLLAAVVWGTFVSPRAPVQLPLALHLLVQLLVFGVAVAALLAVRQPSLAWTLGGVALLNAALLLAWKQ